MSATLGDGGDLERLTGRDKIQRVAIPQGWEQQGVGRRFFMFPGMSLDAKETDVLRLGLMQEAGRSLVLTPTQGACDNISEQVRTRLNYPVFSATDIEASKQPFIAVSHAVAAMANRYDGIDFPKDECRFLCVDGLPKATNSQEKFLMARMGANVLFNERIQTRVIQAKGRCTRSLEDYSAVFVKGQELEDYVADPKRRKHFHPELQAELSLGVDQSTERSAEDFLENFRTFIENSDDWEQVNRLIVSERARLQREPFPAMAELGDAVGAEISYQKGLWAGDFEAAMASAETVLAKIGNPELRGYRALWHYLAGSAAWLASKEGVPGTADKARLHFSGAKKAANAIPWLVSLARYQSEAPTIEENEEVELSIQLERVEEVLEKFGVLNDRSFARREKEILSGLEKPETFENAHKLLGELLGFSAGKVEVDASPDPWWLSNSTCFVFEDHANADPSSVLGANKARQAASHPNWMEANVEDSKGLEMVAVLVSPVKSATKGALPHLGTVMLWPLDEFMAWAKKAVSVIRDQRRTFVESGDLAWRANAAKAFLENTMDAAGLSKSLKQRPAAQLLAESDSLVE